MNFGILTQYLGKWFINPLENFFILWHILILPHFTPYQGQKTIFWWFEQCGICLDMFERVKWPVLWNLSLISIIMRIREKKIGTLSTEIGPAATKIVVIIDIKLKFQSTAHLECFKYPYWYLFFWPKFDYFGFSGANFSA